MNIAFFPDLFALTLLVIILAMVRRRHSDARADAWLIGLSFTLFESIAHTFYAPVGIPESFEEHIKLMFDLQVVAFQTDLTRVSTFMLARELSQRTYPQVNCNDPHHSISHHEENPEKKAALTRLQNFHMQMFAYYLGKLRATPDGDGTLLDHSMILYGSNMSNSNLHNHFPLPVVLVGGAGGQLTGNRHLKYTDRTPMTNLLMSMLGKLDIPLEHLGDSTGTLAEL